MQIKSYIVHLLTEKASVQWPGLVAGMQTTVKRFALIDFDPQLCLVLTVGNSDFNQMLHIDTSSKQDKVALVNCALGKTFQIVRCLDGRLILGCSNQSELFGRNTVGNSAFFSYLGNIGFCDLQEKIILLEILSNLNVIKYIKHTI